MTIDKDSQTILEVRRNWKEDDDRYIKHMPIVKYPFVDGLGLLRHRSSSHYGQFHRGDHHRVAVGAGQRGFLLLAGVFVFRHGWPTRHHDVPGWAGRRRESEYRWPADRQSYHGLPYKDVTAGLVQITQHIEEEARRVGGTPELMVGEGRQDVPVGTTLAMLDQAVKVLDTCTKGCTPPRQKNSASCAICSWKTPIVFYALHPRPRPGVGAQRSDHGTRRLQSYAAGRSQHAVSHHQGDEGGRAGAAGATQPEHVGPARRGPTRGTMVGLGNVDELFAPPQGQMDGKQAEKCKRSCSRWQELAQKEKDSQRKAELELLSEQMKVIIEGAKIRAWTEQNASRERIEGAKLATEAHGAGGRAPWCTRSRRRWPRQFAQLADAARNRRAAAE